MTKEFEEKNYNWGKEFDEIWESSNLVSLKENLKNFVYRKVLEQTDLFISKHFLPKSKVREMTDKLWDKVPENCDEYSYHRGLNDLVSNLMDLDL